MEAVIHTGACKLLAPEKVMSDLCCWLCMTGLGRMSVFLIE